jgi:glycosyltransferase involved in cell wall biosynthesis
MTAERRLRVAMALYGDLTYDSRVIREAETLASAGHAVTVHCLTGASPPGTTFGVRAHTPDSTAVLPDGSSPYLRRERMSVRKRLAARVRWIVGYARNLRAWGRWAVDTAGEVDVWHAHDLTGLLAVAPLIKRPTRLVYDSHEIFLETGSAARLPGPLRRLLGSLERRLTRRAWALITVNEGYAGVLGRRLRPRRIVIVRNCAPRWTRPDPARSRLRIAAGVREDGRVALYHGMLARDRGIEQLAASLLAPGVDNVHAVVLGFGDLRPELDRLAAEPTYGGRLHILDPVPPGELLDWVADADVDVIALQRSSLNHWLCTPNKLWESLMAGVPVVVSDFPGMRGIVLDGPTGPLGAVCDPGDPASLAAAVRAIVDRPPGEVAALRERCRKAAADRWNWESEAARLAALYQAIATRGPGSRP